MTGEFENDGPKILVGIGIDLVTSQDNQTAICLLNLETVDGIVQYAVNEEAAHVLAAAMERYLYVLVGQRLIN